MIIHPLHAYFEIVLRRGTGAPEQDDAHRIDKGFGTITEQRE